jgi:hypothetical protein
MSPDYMVLGAFVFRELRVDLKDGEVCSCFEELENLPSFVPSQLVTTQSEK